MATRVWTTSGRGVKRMFYYVHHGLHITRDACSYNKAREIKEAQDDFCVKVKAGKFDEVAKRPFPEDLQWESLVDVLRGRVKVRL